MAPVSALPGAAVVLPAGGATDGVGDGVTGFGSTVAGDAVVVLSTGAGSDEAALVGVDDALVVVWAAVSVVAGSDVTGSLLVSMGAVLAVSSVVSPIGASTSRPKKEMYSAWGTSSGK